ncbi:ATP-binding protein [uncultured Sphingorhabdus sp.]|uniref:hybrid sensor histidine kinase/response regulator n=1 Tax=uncultured Sphingorhabdus sp. TaxID=1686106 RepID=UPI0026182A66|nr:ATP-binding protein [uncultured Sphingorhabdus sp.]HMS19924.1 response regulator [Sphingorhabdus sp.]
MRRLLPKKGSLAPEQEILLNRMVMGSTAGTAVYFLSYNAFLLEAFLVYLSLNAALFLMRRADVWKQEKRWTAAILLDVGMAFAVMMHSAETMSFFYPLFLWVILGNGFRFGVKYLVIASALAVAAFSTVVFTTDYWEPNRTLGISLILALIVIPAYCSTLIKKLSLAKEAAEAANRAKGYFLASVSHELRTPLNAIIGYGNHLRAMAMPKNQHDMVEASVLAGEHLLHLIDQLIQIARSDSNAAQVVMRPLRITDLLAEVRDIMLVRADDKLIGLQIAAEPLSDRIVDGPADIIRNILLNLTGNAIKFTEAGTVSVNAGLREAEGKAILWFTVSDTGIGIADDAVAKIFEPFQQADDTVMNRFGGTGLGLAICRQLVTQVGGQISVDSVIGKGSTFLVELPVSLAEAENSAYDSEQSSPVKVLALGMFEHELLAKAQNAGNYLVKSVSCRSSVELERALASVKLADFDIAMIDDRVANELDAEAPVWKMFTEAEVAAVLVSHDVEPDLGEIELRAAFATVIPADASFNELRSAIRIGCSFAHKPHFDERASASTRAAPSDYSPRSVLVADDNRTNRNILTAILEAAGHKVTQVCDGDEVLEILEKEKFDILLLDVNMPRLNGIDACRMWRQIEGNRAHLPIVGVTADATTETETRCLGAGMDLRLTKPINAALLLETIEKFCGPAPKTHLPDIKQDPLQIVVPLSRDHSASAPNQAIDEGHLDYLCSIGDAVFITSMIEGFVEDSTESSATMQRALETSDPALFRFAAHAFKSASNNIGALQLAALCSKLEKITEADFSAKGPSYFAQVKQELDRAKSELDSMTVVPVASAKSN